MKTKLIALGLLLGGLFLVYQQNSQAVPAPTPTFVAPIDKTPVYQFMEVAYLWEFLLLNYGPDKERDGTWLYAGWRGKYAMARNYTNLSQIEAIFGVPVFLKGPHKKAINYNSSTSFGHYNPAFIQQLETTFRLAMKHPNYKEVLKKVYQTYLQGMALTYKDAYYFLHSNPSKLKALQEAYNQQLQTPQGTLEGSLQEEFRAYADGEYFSTEIQEKANQLEEFGVDWYEKVTAPAFWLRRSLDGTDEQWLELLELVMERLEE